MANSGETDHLWASLGELHLGHGFGRAPERGRAAPVPARAALTLLPKLPVPGSRRFPPAVWPAPPGTGTASEWKSNFAQKHYFLLDCGAPRWSPAVTKGDLERAS